MIDQPGPDLRQRFWRGCMLFLALNAGTAELCAQHKAMPAQALIAMIERGELVRAEAILRKNLPRAQQRPEVGYLLGLVLLRRWSLAEATEYLQKAVELRPDRPLWRHTLAKTLAMQGRCEQAQVQLDLALAQAPNSAMALDRARCMLEQGQLESAVVALTELLENTPDYPDATLLLGKSLAQLGRSDEARTQLQKAIAIDADALDARLILARLNIDSGALSQADVELAAILAQSPDHAAALYARGQLMIRQQRPAEGKRLLARFAELAPRREAMENRQLRISLDPNDVSARMELSQMQLSAGQYREAVAELQQLLSIDPSSVRAYRLLAEAHARLGESARAAEYQAMVGKLQAQEPKP